MVNLTEINEILKQIKILLLDVDGVLTDGSIIYNDQGIETKAFNAKDGLGIRLLMEAGIKVGIVTGRRSEVLVNRCNDLGIKYLFDNVKDKGEMLELISSKTGIAPENTAFMGDDLIDLPLMMKVGFSAAVADAAEPVKNRASYISSAKGGRGAVREVCEMILKAHGLWENIQKRFS